MSQDNRTRLNVIVALACAVALVLATLASVPAHAARHLGKASLPTLKLAYYVGNSGQLARTLDPIHIGNTTDEDMILLTNASLVHISTTNKVAADLASHWKISKDHKTYTFYIRKNARFANGDYVTAQDVKYSIERVLRPSSASELYYYDLLIQGAAAYNKGKSTSLPGVRALNRTTVQIRTIKPAAYFLDALAFGVNDVLDPVVVAGKPATDTNNYLTNTCKGNRGAGPFTFVCLNNSSSVTSFYHGGRTPSYTLVPNKYYYGRKAHVKLVLPAIATAEAGYDQYLAGQMPMTDIPSAHLGTWRAHPRGQFHSANTSSDYWLSLNVKLAPFNNVNCRLAVAWAIDRNGLAAIARYGVRPLYTILPPGFPGYVNDTHVPRYNLAKARSYFNRCPSRSTPVVLKYATGSSDADKLATAMASMIQGAGFHVSLKSLLGNEWDTDVASPMSKTNTQIITNGWSQDYPDPQDYLTNIFGCKSGWNINGFCHPRFQKITQRADATFKPRLRYKLYQQAQRLVLNQGVVVTTYLNLNNYLLRPWVHGMVRTAAYFDIMPKNLDWSKVHISKH